MRPSPWPVCTLWLAACASAPPRDALAMLARGESLLVAGDAAGADAILGIIDEASYAGEDLERFKLARARALFGVGASWKAFLVLRNYMDDHPLSRYVGEIERLTYDIGSSLLASDWRFWIFASDEADGIAVLEHFVRRFPKSEQAADAYHQLGETAYRNGDWAEAQRHFRQITVYYDRSPWQPKAMVRYAMAGFLALRGPEYDIDALETTRRELESCLQGEMANAQLHAEAAAALAQTREWLAKKHLEIARFYRTVGNANGERLHLQRAAGEFPGTAAAAAAQGELDRAAGSRP